MDSLDLLKQDWQKDTSAPQINKMDVSKLIRKNSKSIVKWIIIVCVLELCLGIYLHFDFISGEGNDLSLIETIVKYTAYVLLFIITANIIKGYFRIRNDQNVEALMKSILYVKRYSTLFISVNVIYIILSLVLHLIFGDMYQAYSQGYIEGGGDAEHAVINNPILIAFTLVIALAILGMLFTLYYQLIYFKLVKKLEQNYKELFKA